MSSCNMVGWLWIVMTIAVNNAHILSGDPRRYPRRLSRSCEVRNVDNPCLNGGRCHVTLSGGEAAEPALVTCRCPPAWTGATCELERDPCTDGSAVCGPGWSCVRNSSNTAAGYDCGCGGRPGWRRLRDGLPRCVDVDECALLAPACFNGGRCHNRAGTYQCVCRPGFSGGRCELGAPPSRLSADGWHVWSAWSPCRGPCGGGRQQRTRICGRRLSGCSGDPEQSRTCVPGGCRSDRLWWMSGISRDGDEDGDDDRTWRADSEDQVAQPKQQGGRTVHRKRAPQRSIAKVRQSREERTSRVDESTDSASKEAKLRRWRDTRKTNPLVQNWKLVHYLGFEPARRKRSLAQIESYDDLELTLMGNDPRIVRDLGEEEYVSQLSQSGEHRDRVRRSFSQDYFTHTQPGNFLHKRSTEIIEETDTEETFSPSDTIISVDVPNFPKSSGSHLELSVPVASKAVTNLTLGHHSGSIAVLRNISSAEVSLTEPSGLEAALRQPAAAVRALVGPMVSRARAALLRLRLTEAARAERQEAALAAAEAAEQRLKQARQEADERTAARRAAEKRLWQLLDQTEAAARIGSQARLDAQQETAHREAAEARLEAERRRRHRLRQEEAAAAARHAAIRAQLLRHVQEARRQAAAQSEALEMARRQAEAADRKAREAEAERRLQRRQLRQLEAAERQKLAEVQRHGAEELSSAIQEAEREERRAQEAEHAWKKVEHQAEPVPEPPTERPRHKTVETDLRVTV